MTKLGALAFALAAGPAYAAMGDIDTTYGNAGTYRIVANTYGDTGRRIFSLPDGKALVVGSLYCNAKYDAARLNADGSLDASFGDLGRVHGELPRGPSNQSCSRAIAVQPDGKLVFAGNFNVNIAGQNTARIWVARTNPDGTADSTFGTGGAVEVVLPDSTNAVYSVSSLVESVVVMADGSIVTGGTAVINGNPVALLLRLSATGVPVSGFGAGGRSEVPRPGGGYFCNVRAMREAADGKLLFGNDCSSEIGRLNVDGSLDATFGTGGVSSSVTNPRRIEFGPSGSILIIAHNATIRRLTAGGLADGTYNATGSPSYAQCGFGYYDLSSPYSYSSPSAVAPDGSAVLVGMDGAENMRSCRLYPDGTRDFSYGEGGTGLATATTFGSDVRRPFDGIVTSTGNHLVLGYSAPVTGNSKSVILSVTAAGALDGAFADAGKRLVALGGNGTATALIVSPLGEARVFHYGGGQSELVHTGLTAAGTLDPALGPTGRVHFPAATFGYDNAVYGAAALPDGRLVVVSHGIDSQAMLRRVYPDGSLDATFGSAGIVRADATLQQVRVLADGKLLAFGSMNFPPFNQVAVMLRFLADGTPDTSFGPYGGVAPIAVAGYDNFGVIDVSQLADGRYAMIGHVQYAGAQQVFMARFLANGQLDASFGSGGIARAVFESTYLGKVLAGGGVVFLGNEQAPGANRCVMRRFTAAGQPDPTFNGSGRLVLAPDYNCWFSGSPTESPDGKILVAGLAAATASVPSSPFLARITQAGTVEAAPMGRVSLSRVGGHFSPSTIGTTSNGGIVVAGTLGSSGSAAIRIEGGAFTTLALTPSATSAMIGDAVTLTAAASSLAGTPTGTVRFLDGEAVLGSNSLDGSGQAQLVVSSLAPGVHALRAVYDGDAVRGGGMSAPSAVTVSPGPPASIVQNGSGQSANINSTFPIALSVVVRDAGGNPIPGALVTFTAPLTGASATLSNSSVPTDAGGQAQVVATANGVPGSYQVTATVASLTSSFSLTNLGAGFVASASSISFADQDQWTVSPAQLVTISNNGTAPLLLGAITVTGDFQATGDCGSSVAPAASCTLQVRFVPQASGVRIGILTIPNNVTFTAYSIVVAGYGNPPPSMPTRGDANGDGRADLYWRDLSGAIAWWLQSGPVVTGFGFAAAGADWSLVDVADFDGNRAADLLWRNTITNAVSMWFLQNGSITGSADLGTVPAGFVPAGAADLDSDGKSDIVWRNAAGVVYGWLMSGGTIAAQGVIASPSPSWTIVDLGDMDGDGRADILYRHATTGEVWVMFMNGLAIASQGSAGSIDPTSWNLVATADFDGDGKGDFLWRSTSGDTWIWRMDGTAFVGAVSLGNPGAGWAISSVADLSGDGRADIVWRHTDGTTYLWVMNGTGAAGYFPMSSPGGTWQIVAP